MGKKRERIVGERCYHLREVFVCLFVCFLNIHLFIWLHWVLFVALGVCSCSMQTLCFGVCDLVPGPGIEPGLPVLGARSLSY